MAVNKDDVPPIPVPPSAGPPPVEPAPVVPKSAAKSAPKPPTAPAAPENAAAPQPLPPVAPPARPDPYAAPAQPGGYAAPAQPGGYAQPGYPAYTPVPAGPPQGLSLASMITGIGAVLLSFASLGLLPAIAAVVLGHLGQRRQPYARTYWLTGLITGYIGLGISLIWGLVYLFAVIAAFTSSFSY